MKILLGILFLIAVAAGLIYLDWANVEEKLESWAADEIDGLIHSTGKSSGAPSTPGVLSGFVKGVKTKLINKELGTSL